MQLMFTAKGGFTYIISNQFGSVLYIGVTSDIKHRLWQHRTKFYPASFSAKYNLSKLVFYKFFGDITEAIDYEKYLKGKSRKFKENVISELNPQWHDLTNEIDNLDLL